MGEILSAREEGPRVSRPTTITLLAMWTLSVLTAGAGALAIETPDPDERPSEVAEQPLPPPTRAESVLPATDQLRFNGGVGTLEAVGGFSPNLVSPIAFDGDEQGSGNGAEISGVLVGPEPASIVWDAGRPLIVTSDGNFSFEPVPVALRDGTLRANVGGSTATISPGTYRLDTPVAVGREGLAEPLDQVEFAVGATEAATIEFTGNVSVDLAVAAVEIRGPGGLTIEGTFTTLPEDGTERPISRVVVEPDADYTISLVPFGGGWLVDAQVPAGSIID